MGSADRRRYPRLEGDFPVDLLNMGDDPRTPKMESIVPGHALDVSRQGLRLKVPYNVPLGSVLSVILYYRGRESVCLCQVMWKQDLGHEQLYGLYIKDWSKLDAMLDRRFQSMTIPASASTSTVTA